MSENNQKEGNEDKKEKPYNPDIAPFSWDKLDGLLAYKSTLSMCADILECHENSIKNHIKKRYGLTFTQYAEKKLAKTKIKLISKAIEMGTNGHATMLIFSLKNICGWSDKIENTVVELPEIKLAYKKDAE